MNKRKKIKQLKHEVKVLNNTSEHWFEKLLAVESALNPDNQIIDINRPELGKRVADLVQENKRLSARVDFFVTNIFPRLRKRNERLRAQVHKDQEPQA